MTPDSGDTPEGKAVVNDQDLGECSTPEMEIDLTACRGVIARRVVRVQLA
jgi:hypothetical protein